MFVCGLVEWLFQSSCVQRQDPQPHQPLQRTRALRAPQTSWAAAGVRSRSACVTASAPSPPVCRLASSSPCCCCCWTQDRFEDICIQPDKKPSPWDPFLTRAPPPPQIPPKDCSVYDPAFSSGEMDVLRELGLTVLTENEVSCWQHVKKKKKVKSYCMENKWIVQMLLCVCKPSAALPGGLTYNIKNLTYLMQAAGRR